MISDEMAYREYLEGREESADILVDRYGDALTYYINRGVCEGFCEGASD